MIRGRICTLYDEEEWAKVLDNYFLSDLVLDGFGDEPIAEYGSYRKIPKELRKQILNWLRKQDAYYEMLLGDTQEEEKQETADDEVKNVTLLGGHLSPNSYLFD